MYRLTGIKIMKALITFLGVIFLFALVFGYAVFMGSIITYKYYYWFMPHLWSNAPDITFTQSICISMLLVLFKGPTTQDKAKNTEYETNYAAFILPWVFLGLGYLVYLFI